MYYCDREGGQYGRLFTYAQTVVNSYAPFAQSYAPKAEKIVGKRFNTVLSVAYFCVIYNMYISRIDSSPVTARAKAHF